MDNLGNAYSDLGYARKAIEIYEQRLAIAREIGDRRGEENALYNFEPCFWINSASKQRLFDSANRCSKLFEQIESPNAERVGRQLAKIDDSWQDIASVKNPAILSLALHFSHDKINATIST